MRLNEPFQPVPAPHGVPPVPHDGGVTITPAKPGKLLRMPAVMERCALGRSSIYAGVRAGTFPAPVRLGARAVGFFEQDIDRWMSERVSTVKAD